MVMFSIDLEQSDMDELCAVGEGMERFGPEADLAKQHRRYCQVECPAHPAQAGKLFATAGLQSVSSGKAEKRKFSTGRGDTYLFCQTTHQLWQAREGGCGHGFDSCSLDDAGAVQCVLVANFNCGRSEGWYKVSIMKGSSCTAACGWLPCLKYAVALPGPTCCAVGGRDNLTPKTTSQTKT